ncbi:MAG TPA: TolC family protein [Planctomycetota bacterium]
MTVRTWPRLPVLPILALLAGCESYAPEPVDLAQHARLFAERLPDAAVIGRDARGPLDPSDGIDLAEARLIALVFNPELRIARQHAGVAQASAAEAGRWQDPELQASFMRILESSATHPWLAGAGVGLTLPLTGRPALEKELAQGVHARALAEARLAETGVLNSLDAAWVAWSSQQLVVTLLEELLAGLQQLETTAQSLAATGRITQIEARTFTLARVQRAAELVQARSNVAVRELELKRLMGLPPERPLTLRSVIELSVRAPNSAERRQLLLTSPRVLLPQRDHDVAERKLRLAIRKQWPELTLVPGWEEEDAQPRAGLGLSLPIPLWNANAREIAEARAERSATAEVLRAALEVATQDLARAEARARAAAERRQIVERDLLPLAQQQIDDVRRLIELGRLDTLLMLDALTRSFDARVAAVSAAVSVAEATVDLNTLFWPELTVPEESKE